MNHIPEGITIADAPDVRLRLVSRYGQDLLGGPHQDKTAGEVADLWAVYEPDGVTPVAEDDLPLVRAIRHGETVRDREIVQINAEGRTLSLLCNAGPIRDQEGKVTGGIVAWRDIGALKQAQSREIAARKQAEEQIRRLNHDLERRAAEQQAILDAIADGLVVYDRDGRIVRIMPGRAR
jgi:PAS domain-containing protein